MQVDPSRLEQTAFSSFYKRQFHLRNVERMPACGMYART